MYQANQQTIEMTSFGIEGHIIDHSWYHILKKPSKKDPIGKTDSTAVILLADIVYWYKPSHFVDKDSGVHTIGKKFKSDILQRSYAQIEDQFGFSKDQARDSLELLESLEIAERIFRDEIINGQKVANIMYIKFNNKKLKELMKNYYESKTELKKRITSSENSDDPLGKNPLPPRKKPTYTETSSQISPRSDLIDLGKVEIYDFEGKKRTVLKDDLYFISQKEKLDWTSEEIGLLMKRLEKHKGNVRELTQFCKAIIKKERTVKNIDSKGKEECLQKNQSNDLSPLNQQSETIKKQTLMEEKKVVGTPEHVFHDWRAKLKI